ncbi:sperm-associated antigen 5 isoform X1 [Malaclemys terrapin pileata]|uniref:sperm-associated antigen 5 isoform X1 n=2 Tax=Malaclemys terrapin pileata TaxID=2991368 RepID=UPI0023A80966|nr:sperm-associated antigen 5 isoform X1 [Malaclemys terrapin pileata]
METAGPPAESAAAREPRKAAGRAPLQDLSLQPPAAPPKPTFPGSRMEPVTCSSLTPLFRRLRLQDGRSTLPGSEMSPAIKIWADSLPSTMFSPKTVEENKAWPNTKEQQLDLAPNSSTPKASEAAGSSQQMGQGESAISAGSLPGAESGEELWALPDNFGGRRADAADSSPLEREVEKDDADGPCAPETSQVSKVTVRMDEAHTHVTMAENEPCLDSDPLDTRAIQDTAAELGVQEKQSHAAVAMVSLVPSLCSPERPGLLLMGSAEGCDPEQVSATQVLGSPPPSEETGIWAVIPEPDSLEPPSSLATLKEMEGHSSAMPIPGGAVSGSCPLPFAGDQPSLLVTEEGSPQASVWKDVASSSAQKPSLQGGATALTTPVPSCEVGCNVAGTISWMTPLAWLEKNMGTSAVMESLRQSLPLPALQQDAGTSVTPVSACSAGTWMTPRALLEKSMNTSVEWPACAKDSAAETDSLLWHCSREHLSTLSRAELEGRLESTLIIIEALSCQLRDWQQNQWPVPRLGPADQRDVLTQTDVTHPKAEEQLYHDLYMATRERLKALQRTREDERALKEELEQAREAMRSWTVESQSFLDTANTSLQNLQEDQGTLNQQQDQMRALLSRNRSSLDKVAAKLKSCLAERDEMRSRAAEALKAKDTSDLVLEAFRVHASARIGALEQGLESQRELCTLIEEAREHQRSWTVESQSFLDTANTSLRNLQEDQGTLNQQQDQMRVLLSRNRSSLDKVAAKLKSCLAERDEMRSRAAEALKAKDTAARELEAVSGRLEEVTAELQGSVAQVDQLTVANSRLGADLSTLLRDLASLQCERDELQETRADLSEETARLTREQELLRQQHDRVHQELREMTESREFIDQENRVSREQLTETENELRATLAVLRERSMQYEDLKDAYQHLQKERDTLCEELDCSKAEALGLQLIRDKLLKSSLELAQTKERLLDLTDVLQAALPGEAADAASWSRVCTPRSGPSSFVGSVLKAVAGKGIDEVAAGGSTAFTKVEPATPPMPAEIEESLQEMVLELRAAVSHLITLSFQSQKAAQHEAQELQAKICDHQHQLESLESRLQAEIDARDANLAKLNKTLGVRFQTEKELQDIVRQQEEKMLQLIDRSGEVTSLKAEVSHLKHLLRRAETEAEVLWEEVRGREPDTTPLDADAVQEKVWLRQEVNKLRELLLETQRDYQDQRRILEGKLHHAQMVLRSREEMQEKIKEILSSIPDVVTAGSREVQNLLRYLGLKLADGDRCSGDAL